MRCKIGMMDYRNLAIAINRRHVRQVTHQFQRDEAGAEAAAEEESYDDLQAGHGGGVAGMVYARDIQEGRGATMAKREKFRQVSRLWHDFLGFDSVRSGAKAEDKESARSGVRAEDKGETRGERKESAMQRMEKDRRKKLMDVDALAALNKMVPSKNGGEVAFRGVQEEAVQKILHGEPQVVVVMPTGGGKRVLFMLPASVSTGITVVVVPLRALRADMLRRCGEIDGLSAGVWLGPRAADCNDVVLGVLGIIICCAGRSLDNGR